MVVGIDDEEFAIWSDRDSVRRKKLPWLRPLGITQTTQKLTVPGKTLHPTTHRRDPQSVLRIGTDPDGTDEICFHGRKLSAKTSWFIFQISPGQNWCSRLRKLLHTADAGFRGEDRSDAIDGNELRPTHSRFCRYIPTKLTGKNSIFAPLSEELAFAIKDLHAPIRLISDKDLPVPTDGDTAHHIKLAIPDSC